jgi:hypothetical protein
MVTGGALALVARSKYDDALVGCTNHDPLHCSISGVEGIEHAQSVGTAGTIVIAAGAVALGAGIVLWLTAPHADSSAHATLAVAPTWASGGPGLVAKGGW